MKQIILSFCAAIIWLGAATPSQASFLNYLPALRSEVTNRIGTLTGIPSPTPAQKTQLKALGSLLKTIDKPSTTLAGDLKNLASIGKAVGGAFASDVTLSNLLRGCVANYAAHAQGQLTPLTSEIDALPAGALKNAANTARLAAQNTLDQALAGTPANGASLLNGFPKALTSVQKAIAKAKKSSGGGGGGGSGLSAAITIRGTNDNWVAIAGAGAEWVQHLGILDVGGDRGMAHLTVALCSGFNGQPGTYPLAASCGGYSEGMNFYGVVSGSVTIAAINTSARTISGTFSFTASDGVATVTVANGQFSLSNLTVTP